jgi:hypothetical protein
MLTQQQEVLLAVVELKYIDMHLQQSSLGAQETIWSHPRDSEEELTTS